MRLSHATCHTFPFGCVTVPRIHLRTLPPSCCLFFLFRPKDDLFFFPFLKNRLRARLMVGLSPSALNGSRSFSASFLSFSTAVPPPPPTPFLLDGAPELAYGDSKRSELITPGAVLIFELELVSVFFCCCRAGYVLPVPLAFLVESRRENETGYVCLCAFVSF